MGSVSYTTYYNFRKYDYKDEDWHIGVNWNWNTIDTLFNNLTDGVVGNFKINKDGPDADAYCYFYKDGSATGSYIKLDLANGAFAFSLPIIIDAKIYFTSDKWIEYDEYMETTGTFKTNDDMYVGGSLSGEFLCASEYDSGFPENPRKAQIVFIDSSGAFYGYTGTTWNLLG